MLLLTVTVAWTAQALTPGKAFHNFIHDSWSVEQGLPHSAVAAVAQDAEGYIWLATPAGLSRFDGVRFTTHVAATTPGLPDDAVTALKLDASGQLWIGTRKGLARYRAGVFTTVPSAPTTTAASSDIVDILPTAAGGLLLATQGGLSQLVDGRLVANPRLAEPVSELLEAAGATWLAAAGGVYRIIAGEPRFEPLPDLPKQEMVGHLAFSEGELWAGTGSGLYRRLDSGWQRQSQSQGQQTALAKAAIGLVYADRDDNLWVGTDSGLSRIREGRMVEQVDNDRMDTRRDYMTAFEDREGNLWFGSRTHGLTRLWSGLTTRYSTHEGLDSPLVWALERTPDGRIWVGTDSGLSLLADGHFSQPIPREALSDPTVFSLLLEGDDLWVGTLKGAVLLRHGRAERLPALKPLDSLRINGILRDRARRLWFATSDGLFRYAGGVLTRYGKAEGLRSPRVRVLYETRDGRLLFGSQSGLGEWSRNAITMLGGDSGLPDDIDVTAIHELPDRRLVVGSTAEQLYLGQAGRWTRFSHAEGLPANTPVRLFDDAEGHLWVAGLRGLYRVPLDALKRTSDGSAAAVRAEIYGDEFAVRSTGPRAECCNGIGNSKGFIDRGVLWLPTRDGVLSVPTEQRASNRRPPTVRIESANVGDTLVDIDRFVSTRIPARIRDLGFAFSVLSFQDPTAVQLQYRLRGHDTDWQPVKDSQRRHADYTQLPPGDYLFEVRARYNDGIWSPTPASVPFTIQPLPYQTTWFYGLAGLLLVLIAFAAHRWQLRTLERRRAMLESLVGQRTDALALANQQLEKASYTDPLTGLRNRRYLLNQLPQDLAFYRRSARGSFRPDHILLFLLVDIDHFKRINDSHGHGGGDRVLQQFSTLLGELVRTGDYVTRWGGEEFLIVSRPLSREHAAAYASRICTVVSAHPFDVGAPQPLQLSCSVGFAEYPLQTAPPSLDWQDLVEIADRALYHVKENGRNGWAAFLFTPSTAFTSLIEHFKRDRGGLLAEGRLRLISSRDPLPADSQAVAVEFKART